MLKSDSQRSMSQTSQDLHPIEPSLTTLDDLSLLDSFDPDAMETQSNQTALQLLTQAWIDERMGPELGLYKRDLVEQLINAIEKQTEAVMDAMSEGTEQKFISMLRQNEIERIKYVVKSYLRARLAKIERRSMELLEMQNTEGLLSDQELIYVRRYQEIVDSFNLSTFLHTFPSRQRFSNEKSGNLDMVVRPNMDMPVFIRVLKDVGYLDVGADEQALLEKNDIFIIRYSAIRHLLQDGSAKLI